VLIVEHDEAMLASKCEIYQVNFGELGVEVATKLLAPVMATRACGDQEPFNIRALWEWRSKD
jgi:hypothetical protein